MKYLVLLLFLIFQLPCSGQQIVDITWQTTNAAEPTVLPKDQQEILPLLHLGAKSLKESQLIQLSNIGSAALGVPEEQSQKLHTLLNGVYTEIDSSPLFSQTSSKLSYCLSPQKPRTGVATVYLPSNLSKKTRSIVFLHGFGGSFQFYLKFLTDTFADRIIICPAYGISSANISSTYLKECIQSVEKASGVTITKPTLVGISAGGFGGFRVLKSDSDKYSQFVCLAAYPPSHTNVKNIPITIVAGDQEPFVKNGTLRKTRHEVILIKGGDHFFMLSHPEETREILRRVSR